MFAVVKMACIQALADDFTLTHKNSSVGINITNANAGVSNWKVDGVNNLNYQWFYYRVGTGGPEEPIQNIGSPTVVFSQIPSMSLLDATYGNGSYSVRTVFILNGGNPGSGSANLSETITVRNLSSLSLDFHFFQYSDFNLWGMAGGQSVQFFQNQLTGGYNTVKQSDGFRTLTETVGDAITPISFFEANLATITLASLTDGGSTTLANAQTAGPGDVTFAYQWDVVLAPGGSFQLSKLLSIVPEPTTATLALVSFTAFALMRRKSGTKPR